MAARLKDLSHLDRKEKLILLTSVVKILDSILIPTQNVAATSAVLKNLSAFVAARFLSSTFNLTNLTTFWRSTLTSLAIPGSAIEFLAIIFKKTELS